MSTTQQILIFLVGTLASLYLTIVIARFMLQVVRADFYNPVSQFIAKATNPLLMPLRKIIPGFFGVDVACLVVAYGVQMVTILLLCVILGKMHSIGLLIGLTLLGLVVTVLNIYLFGIFILVIVSWVAPTSRSPVISIIHSLIEPILRPIRRMIPPMGGLDFTPLVALLIIQVINIVIGNNFGQYAATIPGL